MDDSPTHPTETDDTEKRRRRSRRRLKIAVFIFFVFASAVICTPYVLSMDWAKRRVERELTRQLGTPVTIEGYSLDWFRGVSVNRLAVRQPPGFDAGGMLLELRGFRGDVGLLSLIGGRYDIDGVIDGLQLRVVQADGSTNLQRLTGGAELDEVQIDTDDIEEVTGSEASGFDWLADLRLDLEVRDSTVEISDVEKGQLEHLRNIHARVSKEFDVTNTRIEFSADLHRPDQPNRPGKVTLQVDADPKQENQVVATVECAAVQLERYRPLIATFLEDGQLTELQGTLQGNARAQLSRDRQLDLSGTFEVDAPAVAGELVSGLHIRSPRWRLEPTMRVDLSEEGKPAAIDTEGFEADLGFAKVTGLTTDRTRQLVTAPALGLAVTLDVAALAEFGDLLPAELRGSGTHLHGEVAVPLAGLAEFDLDAFLAGIAVDGGVAAKRLDYESVVIEQLDTVLQLRNGQFSATAGELATLNGGSLGLTLRCDLRDRVRFPLSLALDVKGAKASKRILEGLSYVLPIFAGLDSQALVELDSGVLAKLELDGPAIPVGEESVLDWLGHWAGTGSVGLGNTKFTPAKSIAPLFALADTKDEVELDEVKTAFVLSEGSIKNESIRLQRRGKSYGLSGTTDLSGALDYTVDVASFLADHRDGRRVLEFVDPKLLAGSIKGTVDEPVVALPSIEQLLGKTLEKNAGDLLKKGLDDLLKGIKKKGGG